MQPRLRPLRRPRRLRPGRFATAAAKLGLNRIGAAVHRDDVEHGRAEHSAQTICAIRHRAPGTTIEVLTRTSSAARSALQTVVEAGPDVFNHNVYPEGPPRRPLLPLPGPAAAH